MLGGYMAGAYVGRAMMNQRSGGASDAKVGDLKADVNFLQWKVEQLLMISEALWEMVKGHHQLTDSALIEQIKAVDMKDGKLDGRVAATAPTNCTQCGRTVQKGRPVCMYCGYENTADPFQR